MYDDIETRLRMSNSDQRAIVVAAWAETLTDDQGPAFWNRVTQEWSGFDAIPHDRFERLFARFREARPDALVAHLPETLGPLYRGQDIGGDGLSWTSSKAVAEGFARGHRGIKPLLPGVDMIRASRAQVAFTCRDRGEDEVVLFEIPFDEDIMESTPVT